MTPSAILTYHSIDPSGSVVSTHPETFKKQMENLAEAAIPVVPLSRIQASSGSVAITFDDGFANFEEAVPVLERYQFPATVFLISGHCGGQNDWDGERVAIPTMPLMTWSTVRRLSGSIVEWGAHTVSHPDLANLPKDVVEKEVTECRDAIENVTGIAVKAFAYPYGSCNASVRAQISKQFELACGTRLHYLQSNADRFELPRLDAFYFREPARMKTILQPGGRLYIGLRRILREGHLWLSR